MTGAYNVDAAEFARQMAHFAELGVKIVGGCCGTSPEYISELRRVFSSLIPTDAPRDASAKLCTPMQIESAEGLIPGTDLPGAAGQTADEIIELALDQADDGKRILTVRFPDGLSASDASACIRSIQSQSDRPLYVVSNDMTVLSAALRA